MRSKGTKTIAENRKARHDYFVLESYEAGIELVGTEVKSIRQGGVNLKDSWCSIDKGELFVRGMHISPYEKGNIFNRDPAESPSFFSLFAVLLPVIVGIGYRVVKQQIPLLEAISKCKLHIGATVFFFICIIFSV